MIYGQYKALYHFLVLKTASLNGWIAASCIWPFSNVCYYIDDMGASNMEWCKRTKNTCMSKKLLNRKRVVYISFWELEIYLSFWCRWLVDCSFKCFLPLLCLLCDSFILLAESQQRYLGLQYCMSFKKEQFDANAMEWVLVSGLFLCVLSQAANAEISNNERSNTDSGLTRQFVKQSSGRQISPLCVDNSIKPKIFR